MGPKRDGCSGNGAWLGGRLKLEQAKPRNTSRTQTGGQQGRGVVVRVRGHFPAGGLPDGSP